MYGLVGPINTETMMTRETKIEVPKTCYVSLKIMKKSC